MASEVTNSRPGVGAGVGPSPFSRPPQPKPVSMYDRPPVAAPSAARPNGADVARTQVAPAGVGTGPVDDARKVLESQRRNGAQWFYWVTALSLINSVVPLIGAQWRFILGLGVTQVVQELSEHSPSADVTAGLISLAVIGLFAFFGSQAVKGRGWAFIAGMVLYALDGVIFLLAQDWAGVGFHAFALVMIGRGFVASRKL